MRKHQWVPVHKHTNPLDGGALVRPDTDGGGSVGGGSSSTTITAAEVPITDLGSYFSSTDVETVLEEIGALLEGVTAHGSTGSTETFVATSGVHTATLNANCTFTFTALASGLASGMVLILTQDGTGSRIATWPGSVVWPGGTAPTLSTAAGAVDVLTFLSTDGGTNWFGFPTGGSVASFGTPAIVLGTAAAAGSASTAVRTDATIVAFDATVPVTQAFGDVAATGSVAKAARRDHVHGMPAAGTSATDANIWRPLMDGAGAVITDGTGQAVMAYGPA